MNSISTRRSARWIGTWVLAALFVSAPASALVILNDDMGSSTYSSSSFNEADPGGSNPDDLSDESVSSLGAGGNPDASLFIQHFHAVERDSGTGEPINGDGSVGVQSFFKNTSTSYNPFASGGITDISFQIDINLDGFGSEGGSFFNLFFTVNDSGGGQAAGFTSVSGTGWQTITVSGLTNANFSARDFSGALDLNFGFGLISGSDVFEADEVISASADNFIVTISVPEPTGLIFVAAGVLAVVLRKRATA